MFELKKIMIKDVVTAKLNTHIYEAMKLLVEKNISGLPVVDDKNTLLGVITEKDVLRLLLKRDITEDDVIANYMNKNIITLSPDDSALTASECFVKNAIRRIPIVQKGKLVGIICRRDIIREILKIRCKI